MQGPPDGCRCIVAFSRLGHSASVRNTLAGMSPIHFIAVSGQFTARHTSGCSTQSCYAEMAAPQTLQWVTPLHSPRAPAEAQRPFEIVVILSCLCVVSLSALRAQAPVGLADANRSPLYLLRNAVLAVGLCRTCNIVMPLP
jgi:hypothetical protein